MYASLIVPVIRNPIYAIAGLIFVITYNYMPHLLFPSGGPSLALLRASSMLIVASVFMAGIGNLLKCIIREGAPGSGDFIEGVRLYFSRVLKVNLLIFIISLLMRSFALVFKPSIMMGMEWKL